MVVDAAVARSLAREGDGGAGPSNVAAAELSDYYKHEMSMYWDSGWTSFKYRADELFPSMDFNNVRPEEGDIAQTPLDEGVEEEDLVSSEGKEGGGEAV
ncbi:hypothetical protein CsSME_00041134 [Camellia sinensis var. sinensis]